METIRDAETETLTEEDLPKLSALCHGEDADELEDSPGNVQGSEETCICSATGKCPDSEEKKYLHRADPGDCRGRNIERVLIVCLVHAKGSEEAKGIEDGKVSAEDLCPGYYAAVGWGTWVNGGCRTARQDSGESRLFGGFLWPAIGIIESLFYNLFIMGAGPNSEVAFSIVVGGVCRDVYRYRDVFL